MILKQVKRNKLKKQERERDYIKTQSGSYSPFPKKAFAPTLPKEAKKLRIKTPCFQVLSLHPPLTTPVGESKSKPKPLRLVCPSSDLKYIASRPLFFSQILISVYLITVYLYIHINIMRMSCNGCRILRKGCSDDCIIKPCLDWIKSSDAQANATLFLAKFYGRAGLINLIEAGPQHLRPGIYFFTINELFCI